MTDLKSWIITRPGIEASGYVESVNDPANLSTTLLWHGPADAMQASILAEAKRRGIAAKVEQRKYSMRDIQKAAKRAVEGSGRGTFKGVTVYSVAGLSADFDGIKVNVQYVADENEAATARGAVLSPAARKAADKRVAENATAELGVAVEVEPGAPITNAEAARGTDTPPFKAGGFMFGNDKGRCSTGFSIKKTSSRTYTTTARHCRANTYRPREIDGNYGDPQAGRYMVSAIYRSNQSVLR